MADPFPEIDFELSAQPHDAFFKSVFSDPVHTEGKAEGKARGVWIGRIISMQELMGLETDTVDSLSELAIIDLERRHEELRREYDVRFRGH